MHKLGHVREAFIDAVESQGILWQDEELTLDTKLDLDEDNEFHGAPLWVLISDLWACTDIMPRDLRDTVEDNLGDVDLVDEDEALVVTYGDAVRRLHKWLTMPQQAE
jgi:hypothetical protein